MLNMAQLKFLFLHFLMLFYIVYNHTSHASAIICKAETIENGNYTGNEFIPKSTITYHCNKGYSLNGQAMHTCYTDGHWSADPPKCEITKCLEPSQIANGEVKLLNNSLNYLSFIRYTCNTGYILKGTSTQQCNESGNFNKDIPKCVVADCGYPKIPQNGFINHLDGTTWNRQVYYSCNKHTTIDGETNSTCKIENQIPYWYPNPPKCNKHCQLPDTKNAYYMCHNHKKLPGDYIAHKNYIKILCDVGYEIAGDLNFASISNLTCEDGKMNKQIECVKGPRCTRMKLELENANVEDKTEHSEYYVSDEVQLKCKLGYTDSNNDILITKCIRLGDNTANWNITSISCKPIMCKKPQNIRNGYYDIKEFTFGSIITFNCNKGYSLNGSANSFCLDNATWSTNPPKCQIIKCLAPSPIENGVVEYDNNSVNYLSLIRYFCNTGYILKGESVRNCTEYGNFSNDEPKCVVSDCGYPDIPENGFISSFEGTTWKHHVYYSCNEHTTIDGQASAICKNENQISFWDPKPPKCNKHCQLSAIKNAYFVYKIQEKSPGDYITHKDIVVIYCNTGYEVKENSKFATSYSSVCEDGNFDKHIIECTAGPHCVKTELELKNAYLISDNMLDEYYVDAVIHVKCVQGYINSQNDILTTRCKRLDANVAKWTITKLSCTIVTCEKPENIKNGYYEEIDRNQIKYHCNKGYELEGYTNSFCSDAGEWSNEPRKCEIVMCPDPPLIQNGYFIYNQDSFVYLSVIQIKCNNGYFLQGPSELKCTEFGNFSTESKCVAIDCGDPEIPKNGKISFRQGTKFVEYSCNENRKADGQTVAICKYENQVAFWDPKPPICLEYCSLPNVQNAYFIYRNRKELPGYKIPHEGDVTYHCNDGYEITDDSNYATSFISTCTDGILSGQFVCAPSARCSKLHLENAHIIHNDKNEYRVGEDVFFMCIVGYTSSNNYIQTKCERKDKNTANWTSITNNCKVLSCDKPKEITNGYYEGNNFTFGSKINYKCNKGYFHDGLDSSLCLSDGKWSSYRPTCKIITCSKPFPIENGVIVYINNSLEYLSILKYICNTGFVLEGPSERQCTEYGNFTDDEPKCVEDIDCGPPGLLKNGIILYAEGTKQGKRVYYSCNELTTTVGQTVATCKYENGITFWHPKPPECFKYCQIPNIDKAYFTYQNQKQFPGDFITHGEDISIFCKDGYEILFNNGFSNFANQIITECINGEFSTEIECRPVDAIPDVLNNGDIMSLKCYNSEIDGAVYLKCAYGEWQLPNVEFDCRTGKKTCDIAHVFSPFVIVTFNGEEIKAYELRKILHGEILQLTCKKNYELYFEEKLISSGRSAIFCNNGALSRNRFECLPTNIDVTPRSSVIPHRCKYEPKDRNLFAFSNGKKLSGTEQTYLDFGSEITFRCFDITEFSLVGIRNIHCKFFNKWNGTVPTCKKLLSRNTGSAPVITYDVIIGEPAIVSNSGDLLIRQFSDVSLKCWWFKINGTPVWKWNDQEVDFTDFEIKWNHEQHYELMISKVESKDGGNFTCITPHMKSHSIYITIYE